jgi:hypothetical protein
MNRWFFILLIAYSTNAFAGIEVDRIWTQGDWGMVLVTYTNESGKTHKSAVLIKCVAINSKRKKIGVQESGFFVHKIGPIKPGFSDTIEVPIALNGAKMKKVDCKFREK